MSHSKRNTSLAFFTNHERAELKGTWGSRQARLNRDSFLPFGSCQLCLLQAREPVACPTGGHLFCRECALSNILAQSQDIKRAKREAEKQKLELEEDKELQDAEKSARDLDNFERVLAGGVGTGSAKRKAVEDDDELARLAREGGVYSGKRRKDGKEGHAAREPSSFWTPEAIPENKKHDTKATRKQPVCPATTVDNPHDISLKALVTVNFNESDAKVAQDASRRTCPSCNKALSNSTKAILAKPCGHVICRPCSDKFQRVSETSVHDEDHDDVVRCYVCLEDVTPGRKIKRNKTAKEGRDGKEGKEKGERGLVELSSDGTGFAGGGKAEVKKSGLAFQC